MDIKEENILSGDTSQHGYYKSKCNALLDMLTSIPVTDVLGTGIFSKMLLRNGKCERAVCLDPAYPSDKVEHYHGHSIRFVRSLGRIDQSLLLILPTPF